MKKTILIIFSFLILYPYKCAIVGLNLDGHGLSQITQGLKSILEISHDITVLSSRSGKNTGEFDFVIFTDSITCFKQDLTQSLPKAKIKIAYCLWETDKLPEEWVTILNNKFDFVIVASSWFVNKYIENGVQIPIFCIPLGLDTKKLEYIDYELNNNNSDKEDKFYFTCISSFFRHKNQLLLLEVFQELFNNSDVGLILSGHAPTYDTYFNKILAKAKEYNNKNIIINSKQLDDKEFAEIIKKTSVLLSISTGEGFSYTPREAAALGIPTIIPANTAYWDLIENDYASIVINCPTKIESFCILQNKIIGNGFLVCKNNLKNALINIYKNYNEYKKEAQAKKELIKNSYSWQKVNNLFTKILEPQSWFLNSENKITNLGIFCNDKNLIDKINIMIESKAN